MKFVINARDLKEALALTGASVDRRQGHTGRVVYLHAYKKTDSLLLFTTDGICRMMLKLSCKIEQGGETCVDHALFQKQIGTIPSNENVVCDLWTVSKKNVESRRLSIVSGPIRGQLPEAASDMDMIRSWLKMMPVDESAKTVMTVPANDLLAIVRKVGPFVSVEGDNDNIKKLRIKVSGKRVIGEGTNRAVMAQVSRPIQQQFDTPVSVSLPSRGLDPLEKALHWANSEEADIITYMPENQNIVTAIYVRTDNLCFGVSTNDLEPPNLEPVLARVKPKLEVEVAREELAQAISRTSGFGQGTARYIELSIGGHGAIVAKGEIAAMDSAFQQEVPATTIHPDPNDEETAKLIYKIYASGAFMSAISAAPDADKIRIGIEQQGVDGKRFMLKISHSPTPKEHPDAPDVEEESVCYVVLTSIALPEGMERGAAHGGSMAAS